MFASRSYEWVFEADITACFDEIDHTALMGRVRRRVGDKRVLALVKAFLKAGALSEDQVLRRTDTGTPQGGILSPLLANIALEVLDEHFARVWTATSATRVDRSRRRRRGEPIFRLVRYADDFVVLVSGSPEHAEALWQQTADVLAPLGLPLSGEKTSVVHIDDGFDFLGFRIERHRKPGTSKSFVYTFPARKSVASVRRKVKAITKQGTNQPLSKALRQLNLLLRGWTRYFRHGVSKRAFGYLRHYMWSRVVAWLRNKHRKTGWKALRRRYSTQGWVATTCRGRVVRPRGGDGHPLTLPGQHRDTVGRARACLNIGTIPLRTGCGEVGPVREAVRGNGPVETTATAPRADLTSPATPWTAADGACSRPSTGTAAATTTPSTERGGPCTPAPACSPRGSRTASTRWSPPMSTPRSR